MEDNIDTSMVENDGLLVALSPMKMIEVGIILNHAIITGQCERLYMLPPL